MSIAVCVITCLRPDGLHRLLEGLAAQQFTKNARPNIQIVVVDNDAEGSAQSVCEKFTAKHDLRLDYDIEKQRGIPFARNHAVDMAKDNVDFIAIIDDDEVPTKNWLDELMVAQKEFEADILTGPVDPHFMEPTADWLHNFFGSGNLPNGQNLLHNYGYAYTSNLLAKAELFQHLRFDERFAVTGAEDTHLFMQVFDKGYKAVWANNALVTEWLPASRTNLRWLWQRAYSRGNRFAFCELARNRALRTKIQRLAKGGFRLMQGVGIAIISVGRRSMFVRGVQTACLGAGMITGSFGVEYQEYKRIHRV
ncbi:MAG: glycosyltransferase [Leptolyngbyaceae cyanobacterium SM1_3_5]|nr:glycosyltransferase [Leptolyngbyaceae cyanobacterium SM1_3_5]